MQAFPPVEPTKEELHRKLLEREEFKDKQMVQASEPVTLIIGIKCNDGILMQGDTQIIQKSTLSTKEQVKIFPIPEVEGASYVLALSGTASIFDDVKEIFKRVFIDEKSKKPKKLKKSECKKLVNRCRNIIIKELVVNNAQEQGVPMEYWPAFAPTLGVIFGATVTLPDGKDDTVLYRFEMWDSPTEEHFTYNGSVNDALDLFYKIGKHSLQRMGMTWESISAKFVAQLLTFAFRYIPDVNKTIGKRYNSYLLTTNGCKQFSARAFFPDNVSMKLNDVSYEVDYIPELINTAIKEIGLPNIMRFMKVKTLDELKHKLLGIGI